MNIIIALHIEEHINCIKITFKQPKSTVWVRLVLFILCEFTLCSLRYLVVGHYTQRLAKYYIPLVNY